MDFLPSLYYRVLSTTPLFCNSTTVPLFLCHMKTAQPSQTQSLITVVDLLLGCTKMGLFLLQVYFFNASKGKVLLKIGMQYRKLMTDARFRNP